MPILLTDPLVHDPGHGAAPETYNHVKIIDIRHQLERRIMILTLQYGNKVAGVWTSGKTHPRALTIQNIALDPGPPEVPADPAYDNLIAAAFASSTENPLYAECAAALYAHLIAEGYYVGTVV